MGEQFTVFISWSKEPANQIASRVKTLLESVFALNGNITFFLSSSENGGIDKGERVQKKLDENLFKSNYGILILTRNNYKQPWLMFEAGALAKNTDSRVSPIFFDRSLDTLEDTLQPFQNVKFAKEEFSALCQSILKAQKNINELKDAEKNNLSHNLESEWNKFETDIKNLLNDPKYKIDDLSHNLLREGQSYEENFFIERESHLKNLIDNLCTNSTHRIIIFGGIPTIVRNAKKELVKWIVDNEESNLFICYEDENLVNDRKEDLTDKAYEGANKEQELTKRKNQDLEEFKSYFRQTLSNNMNERIHFVELSERLSGYVTINGNELFFTPLLHKRSSRTFTFGLQNEQRSDVVDYMISKTSDNKIIKTELETIKIEIQ